MAHLKSTQKLLVSKQDQNVGPLTHLAFITGILIGAKNKKVTDHNNYICRNFFS